MSFAGSFGPSGAIVAPGAILTAIPESNVPTVLDVTTGLIHVNNAQGQKLYGGPTQRFNELAFLDGTLTGWTDSTIDGSAADTGILTSAVPSANQHGVPVNFGPGRGNWEVSDFARLRVLVQPLLTSIPATTRSPIVMPSILGGDLVLIVKNVSDQVAVSLNIWLKYSHSIEG